MQVARLGDICEIYTELSVPRQYAGELGGARFVSAYDLRETTTLSVDDLQHVGAIRGAPGKLRLRTGDILLPKISKRPRAVLVSSDLDECYADRTLTVLRPTAAAPPPRILADYLRSAAFQEFLGSRSARLGDALRLLHSDLADLPIPVLDPAFLPEAEQLEVEVVRPKIILATDQLIEHLNRQPSDLYTLAPRRFEELIAELLEDMGWEVSLTKATRDGGRDILAFLSTDVGRFLCLVEAKRYAAKRPVGIELVRSLYGALCDEQANSALLVTTSYFSADAREFQRRHTYKLSFLEYQDVVGWLRKWKIR
jgi:HJR/Mrr/RecB family endonuclease